MSDTNNTNPFAPQPDDDTAATPAPDAARQPDQPDNNPQPSADAAASQPQPQSQPQSQSQPQRRQQPEQQPATQPPYRQSAAQPQYGAQDASRQNPQYPYQQQPAQPEQPAQNPNPPRQSGYTQQTNYTQQTGYTQYAQQPQYAQQQPGRAQQPQYQYGAPQQPNQPYQQQYQQPQQPQPYPYGTPYQSPYYGQPAPTDRWNGLCIVGFVLSFVLAPVGLALSIIALVQINKSHEKSRGMSIAGIVIGAIGTVLAILIVVFVAWAIDTGLTYLDGHADVSYDYGNGSLDTGDRICFDNGMCFDLNQYDDPSGSSNGYGYGGHADGTSESWHTAAGSIPITVDFVG